MSDTATKVKAIIVDKLGVDESEVTSEASFTNDLGADSLDTVCLLYTSPSPRDRTRSRMPASA